MITAETNNIQNRPTAFTGSTASIYCQLMQISSPEAHCVLSIKHYTKPVEWRLALMAAAICRHWLTGRVGRYHSSISDVIHQNTTANCSPYNTRQSGIQAATRGFSKCCEIFDTSQCNVERRVSVSVAGMSCCRKLQACPAANEAC